MKSAISLLFTLLAINHAHATPSREVLDTCLQTKTVFPKAPYVDLTPHEFLVEEDEDRNITSTTFVHNNKSFGLWENVKSHNFGMVLNGHEIPASDVQRLSKHAPSAFNPYTSLWGEIRTMAQTYLCVTYNFEGLGESGSFQNIRATYILDLGARPPKIYYAVGDIRKSGAH